MPEFVYYKDCTKKEKFIKVNKQTIIDIFLNIVGGSVILCDKCCVYYVKNIDYNKIIEIITNLKNNYIFLGSMYASNEQNAASNIISIILNYNKSKHICATD